MSKGEVHLLGLAVRKQNQELFDSLPKAKGYTRLEVISGYIKMGIFMLEVPLVVYHVLKGVRKQRKRRAQRARATATT